MMAQNDLLLLDEVISDAARARGSAHDGAFFQLFALAQMLKDRELSPDEIDIGLVDGRDNGGIDAWYTFLDGDVLGDIADVTPRRRAASLDVTIFTCKRHDTFRLEPVLSLYTSMSELLDLARDEPSLAPTHNDDVLTCRAIFKEALVKTARSSPRISFTFYYVSRGDSATIGAAVRARSDALIACVRDLITNCDASFRYIGARELLLTYRKLKNFSARLKFEEGPLSRSPTNYLGLATLTEYFRFVTDDQGQLKRYLFESNVRDYMGHNYVNASIEATLRRPLPPVDEDFWWLNNGATIIASRATVIGKELHLENIQLVNGLQTTAAIHKCLAAKPEIANERCILVKVLVTNRKSLADRIILATNNQTKVDAASLRATDKIQRDIEDLLAMHNWFYDRRKNYYLNHGMPTNKIVSIPFMSWAILAVRVREPFKCTRARPKYLQVEQSYRRIFDERADLTVFLAALEICKNVESAMLAYQMKSSQHEPRNYATLFRFLYATLYVAAASRSEHCTDAQIVEIWRAGVDTGILAKVDQLVDAARKAYSGGVRKLHRNEFFQVPLIRQAVDLSR